METTGVLPAIPFKISFCTFQEMGGKIRAGEKYPWAEEVPEAFAQLKRLIRDTIVIMGPTTFRAFSHCKHGRDLILFNTNHLCLILTKKKDFSPPKEYPICSVKSLKQVSNIWLASHRLEEIKHEENQRRIELQRQQSIHKKTITPQDIFIIKTEPHIEKTIIAIGGPRLYKRILPYATTIHMFLICEPFPGDTSLPPIDQTLWEQDSNAYREYEANEENKHTFLRVSWKRKSNPSKMLF
ncbi:MAG: dihydrofolate reductase [Candidatus Lloydbacteria bacterium]|nr:dihydrofolate reductase [Candidatus Lloydbacteria bacterium]